MIYATLEVIENRSPDIADSQRWRWRLRQRNGNVLAISGEGYARPGAAEKIAAKVLGGAYDFKGRVVRVHDDTDPTT
jgi:hypothetical protein